MEIFHGSRSATQASPQPFRGWEGDDIGAPVVWASPMSDVADMYALPDQRRSENFSTSLCGTTWIGEIDDAQIDEIDLDDDSDEIDAARQAVSAGRAALIRRGTEIIIPASIKISWDYAVRACGADSTDHSDDECPLISPENF